MEADSYSRTFNLKVPFKELLKVIRSLSIEEKIRVERELEKDTVLVRAKMLDEKLQQNEVGMNDIVAEVNQYRTDKQKK